MANEVKMDNSQVGRNVCVCVCVETDDIDTTKAQPHHHTTYI